MEDLLEAIRRGHPRAIARAISLIENGTEEGTILMQGLYGMKHRCRVIGVTGTPGAGKSTLIDQMITYLRQHEKKVAVLAVDPSSPFSKGALLGDRIRMQKHALDTNVFIRSVGSRGHRGGLSVATYEVIQVLAAAQYDWVILETVGVGQGEWDVMHVVDSILLLLTPGGGDLIQAYKAGIMEIAHLYVVNKIDLPGAEQLVHELEAMLHSASLPTPWSPPIIKLSAASGEGIGPLFQALEEHHHYLQASGELASREVTRIRAHFMQRVEQELIKYLNQALEPTIDEYVKRIEQGEGDPYQLAQQLIATRIAPNLEQTRREEQVEKPTRGESK